MNVWKEIDGYNGDYLISDNGKVKSVRTNRIMKSNLRTGYPSVGLSLKGKTKNVRIHRIVAMEFIDNPYDKRCVNHIDGNKENNNASNLEWATHSENNLHAMRNGLNQAPRGHDQNFSKLTNENVKKICERLENNEIPKDICKAFNVSGRTIYDIKQGNTWSWLTGRGVVGG